MYAQIISLFKSARLHARVYVYIPALYQVFRELHVPKIIQLYNHLHHFLLQYDNCRSRIIIYIYNYLGSNC